MKNNPFVVFLKGIFFTNLYFFWSCPGFKPGKYEDFHFLK